jgi:glycosyltransferase involved in cell wall biosynthesis
MFEGLVPSGLIVSIPNGTPSEVSDRARKMERIAPHDPPVVLYLGNLIESKGYGIVLEAARLAAQRRLRYRFVIAGALAEKTTLTPADYIARHRLENTSFLGPVYGQRKLDLLASADIFVLPTAYPIEGQPIAILEAMQFGLPIISTRQGGIPDIVVDGVNGLLIDPEDPTELLVAVDDLSKHRRWAEVAERNRAEALERYDARLHGVRMLEVFDDVAGAMLRTPPLF